VQIEELAQALVGSLLGGGECGGHGALAWDSPIIPPKVPHRHPLPPFH
jgi:hypothetical protein